MMLTSEWGLGEPRKAPSLGRKDHMHILQPVGNVSSITSLQTFQENPPKHGVFCKNFWFLNGAKKVFSFLWTLLVKNLPAMQETPVRFLGLEDPLERIGYTFQYSWASLMAQMVKNLPAMWETWVQSLGWKDPLEEGMATHFNILAWRIPMDCSPPGSVHGVTKSRTRLSD